LFPKWITKDSKDNTTLAIATERNLEKVQEDDLERFFIYWLLPKVVKADTGKRRIRYEMHRYATPVLGMIHVDVIIHKGEPTSICDSGKDEALIWNL
jgi:hypothetical protein